MASPLDKLKTAAKKVVTTATTAARTATEVAKKKILPFVNPPSNQSMVFRVGEGLTPEQKKRADEVVARQIDSQKRQESFVKTEKKTVELPKPKIPTLPMPIKNFIARQKEAITGNRAPNQSMTFGVGEGLSPEAKQRADQIVKDQITTQKNSDIAMQDRTLGQKILSYPERAKAEGGATGALLKQGIVQELDPNYSGPKYEEAKVALDETSMNFAGMTEGISSIAGKGARKIGKEAAVDVVGTLKKQIGDIFSLQEPSGSLWKSSGNTLYIRMNKDNPGYAAWLRGRNFVESAQEAGNNVYKIVLKKGALSPLSGDKKLPLIAYKKSLKKNQLESLKGETEFEQGYAEFKKLAQRSPDFRDDAIDYAGFRDRLLKTGKYKNGQEVENTFLSATRGGGLTNDELLTKFRERFALEKKLKLSSKASTTQSQTPILEIPGKKGIESQSSRIPNTASDSPSPGQPVSTPQNTLPDQKLSQSPRKSSEPTFPSQTNQADLPGNQIQQSQQTSQQLIQEQPPGSRELLGDAPYQGSEGALREQLQSAPSTPLASEISQVGDLASPRGFDPYPTKTITASDGVSIEQSHLPGQSPLDQPIKPVKEGSLIENKQSIEQLNLPGQNPLDQALRDPQLAEMVRSMNPRQQELFINGDLLKTTPKKPPLVRGGIRAPELNFTEWSESKGKNPVVKWINNAKKTFSLNRETFDRNIDAIAGKDADRIKDFISEPIRQNETTRILFVNDLRTDLKNIIVDELGISPKSLEDKLIQRFGEGRMTREELQAATPKWKEVEEASVVFKNYYDTLLDQVNGVRVQHGYKPIPKRADYFRHFQEVGSVFRELGSLINGKGDLPTSISGITDIFRPGKPFTTTEIKRLGGDFTESAIQGMDNYLDDVTKQMYHTNSVQRVRALEEYIRQVGDEGGANLPAFAAYLRDYGDILAGKSSRMDRAVESLVGRPVLDALVHLGRKTGANMVGGNISSALSNFLPFTQAAATTSKPELLKGIFKTIAGGLRGDTALIDGVRSKLLTRRFPIERTAPTNLQKVEEVAKFLFKTIDEFTAKSIVSGKYYENLSKGLSPEDAMHSADNFASQVLAERSIGQTPNIFASRSLGFLSQFQLEVNNLYSFMRKDMPKIAGGSKSKLASQMLQLFAYSYLLNTAYEKVTGRRPNFDPLHATATLAGLTPETKDRDLMGRVVKSGKELSQGLPFSSIMSGRYPIEAGLPNAAKMKSSKIDFLSEASKPFTYWFLPYGGGQLRKLGQGAYATYEGGIEISQDGRKGFEAIDTPGEVAKSLILGPNSITGPERSRLEQKDAIMDSAKSQMETPEPEKTMSGSYAGRFESELQKAKDGEDIARTKAKGEAMNLDKALKDKSLSPEDRLKRIQELKTSNKPAYDFFIDMVKSEAKEAKNGKLTYEEERMKELGVESGARAEFINNEVLGKLPKDKRVPYLLELKKKGIVTTDVLKQLLKLPDPQEGVRGGVADEAKPVSFLDRLGQLSATFESREDPGAIGYDSTGGFSYGKYQLAHNNALDFIRKSPFADAFRGLTFNSPKWREKWKEVARTDPKNFEQEQHAYIAATHYKPQVDKLKAAGIDVSKLSQAMKDVIWSTAVQHGPNTSIIETAFKRAGQGYDESKLIRQVYALRWGGGKNFAKSTKDVRESVYNRFFGKDGELNTALSQVA